MSHLQLHWVALFASGLLAGCASSQMNRIDANRDLYETWPIETRQAVLDGKVEPGMTTDMVTVAWGRPTQVISQGGPGDEVWVYEKGGTDPTVMYPGGGAYPGGTYPGGVYPGGGYPGGVYPSGQGVTIGTSSRGGTAIGATGGVGIGMGGGMGSGIIGPMGTSAPVVMPGTPAEVREVVFRGGVVTRADAP